MRKMCTAFCCIIAWAFSAVAGLFFTFGVILKTPAFQIGNDVEKYGTEKVILMYYVSYSVLI